MASLHLLKHIPGCLSVHDVHHIPGSLCMKKAIILDPRNQPDLEFAYGSGHINPQKALSPGLVYDTSEADYINFLCYQGYKTTSLRKLTGTNSSVCTRTRKGRARDLNYPTFALAVDEGQPIDAVFTRTVTNVGSGNSTYTLSMHMPPIITVTVEPSTLSFTAGWEKKTFKVKVSGPKIAQQPIMSGEIEWSDGNHVMRSPLVVYNVIPGFDYTTSQNIQFRWSFHVSSDWHRWPELNQISDFL